MIKDAIQQLAARRNEQVYSVVCRVTEVNESARVCSVQPLNGDAMLYDVRLQAVHNGADGVVLVPAVDSWVVVTFLAENDGYVAERTTVTKVLWTVEKQTLEFTADGLKLASDQAAYTEQVEALLDTLGKLIDTLLQFQLSTNMGPTIAVMPQVLNALNQHKAAFDQVKSKLKTMLY
jgi:hypothetical protein